MSVLIRGFEIAEEDLQDFYNFHLYNLLDIISGRGGRVSWSVNAKGKPAEVKQVLKTQFENARKNTLSVPAETKSVTLTEAAVNVVLDQMIESDFPGVHVTANGSASNSEGNHKANCSLNVQILPLYTYQSEVEKGEVNLG
jgi:hypothetical protein